ncbi:MAG: folate-binding protein, partial [Cyanobacteria bacterium P01_H01_bin.121]
MSLAKLRDVQQAAGATVDDQRVPLAFAPVAGAQDASDPAVIVAQQVALFDYSHWGCLEVTGDDRLSFLHNQTTNQFKLLKPGQGCETVFVTSTARTIDLAIAYVLDAAIQVLVSPQRCQYLLDWLDRYIFPFDKIKLGNRTGSQAIFALVGPQA